MWKGAAARQRHVNVSKSLRGSNAGETAGGTARNNLVFGAGEGTQFFIKNYSLYLEKVGTIDLKP